MMRLTMTCPTCGQLAMRSSSPDQHSDTAISQTYHCNARSCAQEFTVSSTLSPGTHAFSGLAGANTDGNILTDC